MNNTNDKSSLQLITPPTTTTKTLSRLNDYVAKTNNYNLSDPDIVKISQAADKELINLINFK